MQYQALYREQRPETFGEILGQEHIVRILRNQLKEGTVSHAYLFCGTRGTGKTTIARILAKGLNCTGDTEEKPCGECPSCKEIAAGSFIDVIEIDAATNNGVDNIRDLRESTNYPPTIGRKKVYIIDEVHMLSTSAANGLLKTLEEPPEDVVFILATTDPEKLPQTILSRCMRMDFRRVTSDVIKKNLDRVARLHGATPTDGALALITANADGSVRDSLSILEQCIAGGKPTLDRDDVLDAIGGVSSEFYVDLTDKVLTHNMAESLLLLESAMAEGKDVRQIMRDWMGHYRSLLIAKFVADPENMINMSSDNIESLKKQADQIELSEINDGIVTLSKAINDARYSSQARVLLEVAIVSLATGTVGDGVRVIDNSAASGIKVRAPQKKAAPAAAPEPISEPAAAPASEPEIEPALVSEPEIELTPIPEPAAEPAPMEESVLEPISDAEYAEYDDFDAPGLPTDAPTPAPAPEPAQEPTPAAEPTPVPELEPEPEPTPTPAPEPGFKPAPEPEPAPLQEEGSEELDQLWRDMFEDAEQVKSSMNIMRTASLVATTDGEFKVVVAGAWGKERLESEKGLLEDLFEKHTGTRKKMVVKCMDEDKESESEDIGSIADRASEILGTDIKIE